MMGCGFNFTLISSKTETLFTPFSNPVLDTSEVEVSGDSIRCYLDVKSASGFDNNSLDRPLKVIPTQSRIGSVGAQFTHEFPANLLTVIRLKTR